MAVIKCSLKTDPKDPKGLKATVEQEVAQLKKGDELVFDGGPDEVLLSIGDGTLIETVVNVPVKVSAVHSAIGFIVSFDKDKGDGAPGGGKEL